MVRVFVALELAKEVKEQLAAAQEVLRGCKARLTFVEPAIIHITVKFLGEVDDKKILTVIDALRAISFSPFTIIAGQVIVNNPRRPNTIWCSIDDGGRGEGLFRLLEDTLAPLGFEREKRRFTPHATVARVKYPDPSLFKQLDLLAGRTYGSCTIESMKLKKSTLTQLGPIYNDLLEVKW